MKKATFPRIAALFTAIIVGLATITFAAAAADYETKAPAGPTAPVSSLNKTVKIDGYNPMETAVANYMAKKQAEEAAKAAEVQAAAEAANRQAAVGGGGNSSSGGGATYAAAASNNEGEAWAILSDLIAQYPILQGASVAFGDAQGYEAISYYKSGYIVISPTHTYSLSTLIYHEAMHIINYRQSGQTSE
ncbi:MAG: hypothetical protein WC891_03530 [Actinomycetota bacterium]